MTTSGSKRHLRAGRPTGAWAPVVLALFVGVGLLALVGGASAAATAVPLASTTTFGVLAGGGISYTGPDTVNGDIGTFATTSETGTGALTVNGVNHAGDAVTQQAKIDLVTAYLNAQAQGPTQPIVADLGGQTLGAGVYNSATTIGLTGNLTLDGANDPNSIFVFQAGSALNTAVNSSITLINGAQSCNVFWQVGSDATLGVGSTFVGTVLALNSITADGGIVNGRLLAQVAAVTLGAGTTITVPACTVAPPAPPAPTPPPVTPPPVTPAPVTPATTPAPSYGPFAAREIYCDPAGKAYDLVQGQNTQPPYNTLGLIEAYVDPVTGSKSCNFPSAVSTAVTSSTGTTTTPTPTPTAKPKPKPTPTPTSTTTPKPKSKPASLLDSKSTSTSAAASDHNVTLADISVALARASARKAASAAASNPATAGDALPAKHSFGFTG
jgi:hypothetical protein